MKLKFWRSTPLKWRIFATFAAFAALVLALLWILQILFLDSFYRTIKIREIRASAQSIARNIDNADLEALVVRISQSNEVCISVFDENGLPLITSDILPDCVIHRLPSYVITRFYDQAKENGGEYLERFSREGFRNDRYRGEAFEGRVPPRDTGMSETMVCTRIIGNAAGQMRIIMLNSTISPVGATEQTLRTQLQLLTVVVGLLALAVAMLISRSVARPITRINRSARVLAGGNYDVSFEGGGYREIDELAETLNYAARELSKVEGLRRELIANISHDLRTPLTLIAGYGEVMRDLPGENTPENVQVIIDEARRLTTLVNDVLDISKLQSGTQALSMAPFSLTGAVEAILQRYEKLVEQEGYRIRWEVSGEAWVCADEVRVSQVIYNLVNNAINYTGEDKAVTVRQILLEQTVRLEVSDTGEGIPQEALPYIWDRYYKVDKAHKRAAIGTGLGLSIVKGILELHHASYGVQSTVGQGSTFWFELARLPAPERPEEPGKPSPQQAELPAGM